MERRVTRRHALQAVGTALGASVVSSTVLSQKTATSGSDSASGGSGTDSAQEPTPTPSPTTSTGTPPRPTVSFDYDGSLDGVGNYDGGTIDARGGAFAFDPPVIWVDPGTSVVWNWTGEGGAHSVVADGSLRADATATSSADGSDGALDSGAPTDDPETTFTYTPAETGVIEYHCVPHEGLGMKGVVAVGAIEQARDPATETASPTVTPMPSEGKPAVETTDVGTTPATTATDGGSAANQTTDGDDASNATGPGFTALTLGAGALGALGIDRLRE